MLVGLAYLKWHYSRALKNLFLIWKDFVWFIWYFFSIGELARTLFAPWRRLNEEYQKGLAVGSWGETLIVNTLMRLVGAIFRLVLIAVGLVLLLLVIVLLLPALALWLALPAVLLSGFIQGLILIFR